MKRILYINYMLQYGHINFDLIQINALRQQGYDVRIVAHAKVAERMKLQGDMYALILPDWLGLDSQNGIVNRLMYILTLLYIRFRISKKEYDHIFVSNIDEVSLGLVPIGQNMRIFAHALNDSLKNKVKSFFVKRIAQKNMFVVFNEHMKIPFLEAGITNLGVTSHGCMPPFKYDDSVSVLEGIGDNQKIIFHPSHRPNLKFVEELLGDDDVQARLEALDAIILLRDRSGKHKSKGRIKILADYLQAEVYQDLFLKADIILMAYPDDFLYKVSGVSYECFANKKKMLVLNNPSFFYCKDFFNYDPLFCSVSDLKDKITMLLAHPEYANVADPISLAPDYSSIIQ